MQTSDANLSYAFYRFEFSNDAAFTGYNASDATMYKEFSNGQYPLYKTVSGLQLDHTYYVRVRLKENAGDAFGAAGAICSVHFINDLKLNVFYCDNSIPLTTQVVANDANGTHAFYRFEFSEHSDFNGYDASDATMYKELTTGQNPLFNTISGLKLDHTYYVRIRLKEVAGDPWSDPGVVCSVHFINDLKLNVFYCDHDIPMTTSVIATDANSTHGFYRFEFSEHSDFSGYDASDATMYKELTNGQSSLFISVGGLHLDHTYYVRIRLKEVAGDSWSDPGAVCSVHFINDLKLNVFYCDNNIPLTNQVVATDANNVYAFYRFEFSEHSDFSGYDASDATMYKELTTGQNPLFTSVSGLKVDHTYYVRIRLKKDASESWSNPGGVCWIHFFNDLKMFPSLCDQSYTFDRSIEASDANLSYQFYRFEFSTAPDFSNYNASDASMYKELTTGQYPVFSDVSGLIAGSTYYARVRVRQATSDPWSLPGGICSNSSNSIVPVASFFATNALSLPPAIEWSKIFGGNAYDDVRGVITTKDGGYMFLGNMYSTDIVTNRGQSDYWAVKLDASGNQLWSKNLGSAGFDSPYGMSEDTDGGCLLIGQAGSGTGDFSTLVGSGPNDIVIVKLDANGNLGWLKLIGGNSGDLGTSVKHLASGGYLVTGLSQSATGDIHDANNGDADGVILKLDESRNIQWLKVIGTLGYDFVSDAVELPTGDVVVVGAKTMTTNGEDYFIMKLSSSGTVIWEKTYGGTGEDDANNIIKTNGGFIVTGYAYSTDGDVTDAATGPNIWTIKIDDNGNLVWKKTVGGNGEEKGNAIVQSPEGGSVVAGYTSSNDHGLSSNTTAQGDRDNLLVKYKSNGDVEWLKSFGDGMHERIYGMTSTPDGGFITGSVYSTKNGSEIATGRGTGDALITKLKEPVITACLNSSITFSNTSINGISYLWKVNNVSAGTSSNLTYAFNTAGTYTVSLTATNGGQTNTKISIVTISGGVTANAGPAVTTTSGSGVSIGGNPAAVGGIAPYTYLWNPATALSSATIANPITTATATTTYTLMISDAAGCSSSASVIVTIEAMKVYGALKKTLDAGYYQVSSTDHMLYFDYQEEYKSGTLNFNIYDNNHELKSCPTVVSKQYGNNRLGIDLQVVY